MKLFRLAICLCSLVLVSCGSMQNIEIETYLPSKITFPPEIKTVLIVNNSAQQPDAVGHVYNKNGKDENMSVSCDSTSYDFCYALGKAIAASSVFDDVRLCEDTIRVDSSFYDSAPMSKSQVAKFCKDYGVDAIISLDGLVFNTKYYKRGSDIIYANTAIDVYVAGVVRAQWPGLDKAYAVQFADSLSWLWESGILAEEDDLFEIGLKPDIAFAMRYLAEEEGRAQHINFVPYWDTDRRWFYKSMSSKWKEGCAFANAGKWSEAANVWEPLLKNSKQWKQQAKLSSNLALCYEMIGDFEKAISHAEKSYDIFKAKLGEESESAKIQKLYSDVLKQRMENDKKLSKQLREN